MMHIHRSITFFSFFLLFFFFEKKNGDLGQEHVANGDVIGEQWEHCAGRRRRRIRGWLKYYWNISRADSRGGEAGNDGSLRLSTALSSNSRNATLCHAGGLRLTRANSTGHTANQRRLLFAVRNAVYHPRVPFTDHLGERTEKVFGNDDDNNNYYVFIDKCIIDCRYISFSKCKYLCQHVF